jgi:hypothetical protein
VASKAQDRTIARLKRVDPSATHREVEGIVLIEYTPAWEKGRHKAGTFVPNPNPTRITHAITADGQLHGWGYGIKVELPKAAAAAVTSPETMAEALKVRAAARKPKADEAEQEQKDEPAETLAPAKPAAKKRASKKSIGVKVTAT